MSWRTASEDPYQLRRIAAFLDPWSDPLGKGFHTIQSNCCGSGGLLGLGIGHLDRSFLLASTIHGLYLLYYWRGVWVHRDELVSLVYFLLFTVLSGSLYALNSYTRSFFAVGSSFDFNSGTHQYRRCHQLVPSKGITLPFIGFGGTSSSW